MPGLHLADEVRAHVCGLGEDAAANAHEEGEQRPAEPEADQDGRGGVLSQHDDDGGAEQAETHHEHAGDRAGAEGDLEPGRHRAVPGRGRRSDVASHRGPHADVARQSGERGPEEERQGTEQTGEAVGKDGVLGAVWQRSGHPAGGQEDQYGQGDHDDADGPELPGQVGLGALLDGLGDLDHRRRALVGRQDAPHQHKASDDGDHPAGSREDQPDPLRVVQVKRLVAAFSEQSHDQTTPFSGGWLCRSGPEIWRATFSPIVRSWPSTDTTRGPSKGCFSRISTSTPGRTPSPSRKMATSGSVEPGRATTARSPGRGVESRQAGQVGALVRRDGKAMRTGGRPVQGRIQPVLHLLGQLMLEGGGEPVRLRPAVAEHVGQETLDDAVAADDAHGSPPPHVGELDAVIGSVHGQPPVGQLLDGGGHRPGRDPQGRGQVPRAGSPVRVGMRRQAPDGLQRLPLGFG